MNFYNLDCHISVIADLKKIFSNLGHNIDSKSISGHNWVFNRNPDQVHVINPHNWSFLNQDMCEKFYQIYKHEFDKYDGFVCTYPPSFSMLYDRFEKPIIIQIPIRYEVPFHDNKKNWDDFNHFLRRKIDENLLFPVANSEYDKKYFEFFVNRECELIPNICDYTNTSWNPTREEFLLYSRHKIYSKNNSLIDKDFLGRYEWSDLTKFKGIIIIPYNCSTMSIFEFYTSNVPLFCPSLEFMMELYSKNPSTVLSEISWNLLYKMSPNSIIDCDSEVDPNNYKNLDSLKEWVSLSDFYNSEWMPHIIYFDSFEDLDKKLKETNLEQVSENMRIHNLLRKDRIYYKWSEILNKIQPRG